MTDKPKTDDVPKTNVKRVRLDFSRGATAKEIANGITAARVAHGFVDTAVQPDPSTTKPKRSRIVQVEKSEGGTIIVGGIAAPLADKATKG